MVSQSIALHLQRTVMYCAPDAELALQKKVAVKVSPVAHLQCWQWSVQEDSVGVCRTDMAVPGQCGLSSRTRQA